MKIAILSDIHSNVYALDAVIQDAKRRGYDQIVNLGDILYGPIAPKETYNLLMEHNLTTISGNQDRQIVETTPEEIANNPTMAFIVNDLPQNAINWMAELPFDKQLNEEVYLCHGTPKNDLIYLLENIELGYPQLRSDKEIIELLSNQKSDVVLCGHTHTPRVVKTSTDQLIVNPGSVGLPAYTDDEPLVHSMENYSPLASYSILEKNGSDWLVEQIKVPYDLNKAVKCAEQRNRADWVHFLSTGRKMC